MTERIDNREERRRREEERRRQEENERREQQQREREQRERREKQLREQREEQQRRQAEEKQRRLQQEEEQRKQEKERERIRRQEQERLRKAQQKALDDARQTRLAEMHLKYGHDIDKYWRDRKNEIYNRLDSWPGKNFHDISFRLDIEFSRLDSLLENWREFLDAGIERDDPKMRIVGSDIRMLIEHYIWNILPEEMVSAPRQFFEEEVIEKVLRTIELEVKNKEIFSPDRVILGVYAGLVEDFQLAVSSDNVPAALLKAAADSSRSLDEFWRAARDAQLAALTLADRESSRKLAKRFDSGLAPDLKRWVAETDKIPTDHDKKKLYNLTENIFTTLKEYREKVLSRCNGQPCVEILHTLDAIGLEIGSKIKYWATLDWLES